MASVSPAVSPAVSASFSSRRVPLSRTTLVTGSAPPVSSSVVILSVDTTLRSPLLYTVSGLPASVIANAPNPSSSTAQAPATAPNVTPVATSTIAHATSTPGAPVTTDTAGTLIDVITPLMVMPVEDTTARSLADLSANPVYGGIAAALYVNAAIYRSQHPSADPTAATDLPQPVAAIRADNGAVSEGRPQWSEHRNRGAQDRGEMKRDLVRVTLDTDFTSQPVRNTETQMAMV